MDEEAGPAGLEGLLAGAPGAGTGLSRQEVEELLTRGYALALELEVERHRLVAQLEVLLDESAMAPAVGEVAELRREITTVGRRLRSLRSRLAAARDRYDVAPDVTSPRR